MMKQTIYLVDSENVNDAWVPLMPKLGRRDQIVVFHTKNSPHFTTESASMMAEFQNNITWEKCFTGTNGLDFQLVTRLGYLICKKPRATFVIVSNDTGFDAAIKYWVQEGKQVIRIRGASCSEEAPLEEVQEKIVLEDAPDKQKRRPRKKKKKYPNNQNQTGYQKGQESRQEFSNPGQKGQESGPKSQADNARSQNQDSKGKAENQKSQEPKGKVEYQKSQEPKGKAENQKSQEPRGKAENQKNQEPKDKAENQKSQEPKDKAENQRGQEPKGSSENQKGQEPREKAENQERQGQKQAEKSIPVSSVLGICRSISMNRYELIHESLVALLGAEDGREVYYFLKESQEFQSKLKKLYLQERNRRVENYLQVVFDYHKEELCDTAKILDIINKHTPNDRNGIFQTMTEAFGYKKGARYYSILKQHVRVLKKI